MMLSTFPSTTELMHQFYLAYPLFSLTSSEFFFQTDTSATGLGGVLEHCNEILLQGHSKAKNFRRALL